MSDTCAPTSVTLLLWSYASKDATPGSPSPRARPPMPALSLRHHPCLPLCPSPQQVLVVGKVGIPQPPSPRKHDVPQGARDRRLIGQPPVARAVVEKQNTAGRHPGRCGGQAGQRRESKVDRRVCCLGQGLGNVSNRTAAGVPERSRMDEAGSLEMLDEGRSRHRVEAPKAPIAVNKDINSIVVRWCSVTSQY
jgi:hypothetical protein